jgi:ATP-dependent Clp protease protease subunit
MPKRQHEHDEDLEDDDIDIEFAPVSNKSINLLFGPITTGIAAQTVAWILNQNFQEQKPESITLLINSPGGSASAAFAIIEAMKGSSVPIHTVGLGEICSAGLLIFMNGAKGNRVLTPTCSIMSHPFSTMIGGTYHELLNSQKELNFTHKRILDTYKKCTGLSEKLIMEKLLGKTDSWLSPKDAVKLGIGDKVSGV